MKRETLLFLFLFFPLLASAQRVVENINLGWSYTPGWEVRREVVSESINLPHTWNLDALSAKIDYYRGMGNYLRELNIPKAWQGKKVYLRFKGANQTAEIHINAKRVGSHSGGYTAFGFDITPYLNFGTTNTLWVRVSNSLNLSVMPLVGDFNMYGGIYRDVELIVTPAVHISHTQRATSGVTVTPTSVSPQKATVNINVDVEGMAGRMTDIHFVIRDGDGALVDSTNRRVKIDVKGQTQVAWITSIESPRLWMGVEDPHIYSVDVVAYSLESATAKKPTILRDSIRQEFGLRFFEVDASNRFMLNGKPYPLHGVTRMQDVAMLGSAIYAQNHERDVELIREMGANAVRLTYYPQDPYFIELCDHAGIIVWSEIPFVGPAHLRDKGFDDSQSFKDNGEQQLVEMIAQQYNHPSVMFWGLFNDLSQRGEDPLQYIKYLNDLAKDEDPTRLTVAASSQDGEINFVTDLVGFNQYLGWTSGLPKDISAWGESVRKNWPRLKVAISEYGAGASIYQHQDTLLKPVVNSYWHPENWQTYLHEQYWRAIQAKPFFWGSFACSMFDYGAAHLTQGTRAGINDKGLVTFDRLVKKDAFYFYKANWNKNDKFVYITERRFAVRKQMAQTIRVFSSCADVQLIVNDKEMGIVQNDGFGTFVWKGCVLQRGVNTIEAITSDGFYDKIAVTVL